MTVNYMDFAAAAILLLFIFRGFKRGIAHFAVGITANIISIFLSVTLNGKVSAYLRRTPLFGLLYSRIRPVFGFDTLEAMISQTGFASESKVVESVLANDNSEIYSLFGVDKFADYVASYIANIALNILSLLIVYTIISLAIKTFFRARLTVTSIPIVKSINSASGAIIGFVEGVLIIWLLMLLLIFFVLQGSLVPAYETLLSSRFAFYFYKYNLFLYAILSITA